MENTQHNDLKSLSMMGVDISFLATGRDTEGAWSMLEYTAPPEFRGPAPHIHKVTTEAFFVVEGELQLEVDGKPTEAKAGEFVTVPPGSVHVWRNAKPAPCKFLVRFSPSGLEGYFNELATLMQKETAWPPADMSRVAALGEKFDTFAMPAI